MSFCLPARILTAAPYLIGLILLCLVILMGMYVWRELLSRGDNGGRAEMGLLVGLLIMSVIVIVFFVTFVIVSLTGDCTQRSAGADHIRAPALYREEVEAKLVDFFDTALGGSN